MGEILRKRLLQSRFEGPHHEAILNLMLAASHVRATIEDTFSHADLTPTQYNVLRILNGAHPGGYARCEIAQRMLDHAPDLTRLLDRLVERELVERTRSADDGRRSMAQITPKGRQLLTRLLPRVQEQTEVLRERLTTAEARELSRLCEKLYASEVLPEGEAAE